MSGLEIHVDGNRVEKREDGNWYVRVRASDFDHIDPAEMAALHDRADREPQVEVPITVKVRGESPVPPGEDLRIEFPNESPLGSAAGFDRGNLVVRRPLSAIPSVSGGRSPAMDLAAALMRGDDLGPHFPRLAANISNTMATERTTRVNARTLQAAKGKGQEPQPTLSDMLLFNKQAHLPAVPRKASDAINAAHRTSRVFVFDRAASYRVGELCAYSPDLIADNLEFARCPYPRTFIELDNDAVIAAMNDAGLKTFLTDDLPDERLGFLFTERGIYTAASHMTESRGGKPTAGWSPFAYRPHQPMTQEQERRFMAEFGAPMVQVLDRFLWGNAYDTLDPTRRRSMRLSHGFDVLLPEGWAGNKRAPMATMLEGGGAGDLKVALCAALLLIRPNLLVTKSEREAGRKLHLGKPTTFLAHRVVTIKLDPDRTVRRIRQACKEERGRAKSRWHEVRGHYCHNHRAKVAECVHDWNEVAPLKWECMRGCGGMRWWRECPNGRGDASIGVVTKHYVVKP